MTAVKTYSCSSHKKLPAVILVGNKCDVNDDERKIPYARGKDLADKLGVPFFETSAKSEPGGINVRVRKLFQKYHGDSCNLKESSNFNHLNPKEPKNIFKMP